ncbi:CHAT domain-containing protein [Arthrobacter sp. BHU FT2]|nr:CHAT domain-containing protein [Arthrobacter sp. BHU FT2]
MQPVPAEKIDQLIFQEHIGALAFALQTDWAPLPGLGNPAERHDRIRRSINEANSRAQAWIGRWSPFQEAEHIHRIVEALGALANNVNVIVMAASWSNSLTDEIREEARQELQEIVGHAQRCVSRIALLASITQSASESDEILAMHLSVRVENLGIQSILWANDFSTVPGSIAPEERGKIQRLAEPILADIDSSWDRFLTKASPAWLKAKVKSILEVANILMPLSYLQLAVLAEDDPKTSIEISKLAFTEEPTLEACEELLPLLDRCFSALRQKMLWGEDHRRALAAVQPWLYKAILISARSGESGREAAVLWLSAYRQWTVGTELVAEPSPCLSSGAHLVASDDRIANISVDKDSISFTEVPVSSDFWSRLLNIHARFEKDGVGKLTKDELRYLTESLGALMPLGTSAPYQIIPHGRTALIPWFSLKLKGNPLAAFDSTIASPCQPVHIEAGPEKLPSLAIVDDVFTGTAGRALNAWKKFTDNNCEVVHINTGKPARIDRLDLLEKIAAARSVLFFGHGQSEMSDYRLSGLQVAQDDWITPGDIAKYDLSGVHQLAVIACESGRTNIGVPVSSMGEAFSARGVASVISTLWRIPSDVGAGFLETYLTQLKKTEDVQWSWALTIEKDPGKYGYFTLTSR